MIGCAVSSSRLSWNFLAFPKFPTLLDVAVSLHKGVVVRRYLCAYSQCRVAGGAELA